MNATACTHAGPFETGQLLCTRQDPHVSGHVYESSDVPDGVHDDVCEES